MSILYDENTKLFRLVTDSTEYQMKISEAGILQHIYYGKSIGGTDMSYHNWYIDRGFSGNPYESRASRGVSLDLLSQEYTGSGVGDYRVSSISIIMENGSRSCDLRYVEHHIYKGKYKIPEMPSVREDETSETLEIILCDKINGLEVKLLYGVFAKKNVITRAVVATNKSDYPIRLEKAASSCIDFPCGKYDLIHFHGRHNMERQKERIPVTHDIHVVGSRRGMTSHQQNPFVILCEHNTNEEYGLCYGFMMVYSGNHKTEIEMNQAGSTRVVMGIQDENFSWLLNSGEIFNTPEVILSCSSEGLGRLSHNYHHIIRENVCNPKYMNIQRPVLINNWEATYFNFDSDKIINLAHEAHDIGIEMLVLDDGWFGKRDDDNSGLGDWYVNEQKLSGGLKRIADEVNSLGMKFGLWFEPEMINEDSDLYRQHPDWAMTDPDRKPMMSRNQMLLDMSRKDVQDYLFDSMCKVLDSANIEYVKWDFNRSMSNVFSNLLEAQRQGEVAHRFILGTYSLLERLLERYPNIMIEGCAGGGGRFDAGMLYYCPQIWCSDDTDPIERLQIHSGTSFGYPVCTMGSHVSASPNHQTARQTSLRTRGVVAMSGTFGYELDLSATTENEKEEIRQQIKDFHKYYWLIQKGEYFRLTDEQTQDYFTSWEFAAEDKSQALVNIVITNVHANPEFPFVRLKGLDEASTYILEGTDQTFTGAALMNGGFVFGDIICGSGCVRDTYPAAQYHFVKK